MPPCGKSEHAYPVSVDLPISRAGPDYPERPLRVLKRPGVWGGFRHAVLQENGGHADGIKPFAHFGSFKIHRQDMVPPAGEYENRRPRLTGPGGSVDGNRRIRYPGESNNRPAADQAIRGGGDVMFLRIP
jgi:hypothetical protein